MDNAMILDDKNSTCSSISLNFDDADEDAEYLDDIDNSFSSRAADDADLAECKDGTLVTDNSPSAGTSGSKNDAQITTMTSQANQNMKWLRVLLCLTLLGTFSTLTGIIAKTWNGGDDHFRDIFTERSMGVMANFQSNLQRQLLALESLGITISSYVTAANDSWPFVTFPQFEVQGTNVRTQTDLLSVSLIPIVEEHQREGWEAYSLQNRAWVRQGVEYQTKSNETRRNLASDVDFLDGVATSIFRWVDGVAVREQGSGPHYPIWQTSPVLPEVDYVNLDAGTNVPFSVGLDILVKSKQLVISEAYFLDDERDPDFLARNLVDSLLMTRSEKFGETSISNILYPLLDRFDDETKVVGVLLGTIDWQSQFSGMGEHAAGIVCVLTNDCGQQFTYQLRGDGTAVLLGQGDLHSTSFDAFAQIATFDTLLQSNSARDVAVALNKENCGYSLRIYPSHELEAEFKQKSPKAYVYLAIFIAIFFFALMVAYDRQVDNRHQIILRLARDSNAIVASLFPANIRDRLFQVTENGAPRHRNSRSSSLDMRSVKSKLVGGGDRDTMSTGHSSLDNLVLPLPTQKHRLKHFLREGRVVDDCVVTIDTETEIDLGKPIADLFPNTTVMFADIAGFTAWSSQREPEQVFTLLQTVYHAFDLLAKKRSVFKVETIGDCYVAVTGLPDPQDDHAVKMVKFARECMTKMNELTKKLEVSLGPDTADLFLRIGLNSGPVTAGVLRGEKSRFQLFGDTVNTASRMESTGQAKKIQISQSTADLVCQAGKDYWIREREDLVQAKGKGVVQTYWVIPRTSSTLLGPAAHRAIGRSGNESQSFAKQNLGAPLMWGDAKDLIRTNPGTKTKATKAERLIDWQVDMLSQALKQVVEFRAAMAKSSGIERRPEDYKVDPITTESSVIDEVTETITLPQIDHQTLKRAREAPVSVELSPLALKQLRDYVETISALYRSNPFHNFEHANHVTQSVSKLLSRVKEPDHLYGDRDGFTSASDLDHYTHGITSDPLTQFAVIFSALIHDVDHPGVPNSQLIKEKPHIGVLYNNQSVAEQNSVELAWELLMEPNYTEFQKCIYTTTDELKRFRQLVVNVVMATDIFDKDMTAIRNRRWKKAFHRDDKEAPLSPQEDADLKATIVLEHLIQASDVSHTMQHWHIYTKWNERLFNEMYSAFESGRAAKDPSEGWYKGELWFFDNYIIPLAKKLEECQVFGVSSDEYLNYAMENRKEWELKGNSIVKAFLSNYQLGKVAKASVAPQNQAMAIHQQLIQSGIIFEEEPEEKEGGV